ncbi:MAG: hypothetical protein IT283_04560 [Bacteroidetes bacterium]|nr:hypothetical protein [Bacteroidota bacterium]
MKYQYIREEELKNKVSQEYFWIYDCSKIIGNVDFCVCMYQSPIEQSDHESLLWAEAKKGSSDIYKSIVQLILTIGKARTFDKFLPPAMLGAFDGEKIAFIAYNDIHEVFYINDFNWNVTPSNHNTKEFKLIHEKVKIIIDNNALLFNYIKDDRELKNFIKMNFAVGKFGLTKTKIDKNNFMIIYNKWLRSVKPTISVNWEAAKKNGIIDGDFYIADLLSQENNTLKEKLFVLLRHDHYELDRKIDEAGMFSSKKTVFTDNQIAHTQFWNKYDRPPQEEYWDYIVERRDLLVPQDVRERKGSFFTPQIWVELSQKYLTDVLGEEWQDEYYVWDCAAGTGNLLAGLTNKYNIWASTLDKQDVEVMRDRIKNGANLLDDHVFQFDFLNDDFSKLPKPLQDIINNPKKRKKLVIYINPPYAEGDNVRGIGRKNVHISKIRSKYQFLMGKASSEIFAQFFTRIYQEIPNSVLAEFSKLKILQAPNYSDFRNFFRAKLEKSFVVPADTFDNVKGDFPIGFFIWNLDENEVFEQSIIDVYDAKGKFINSKTITSYDNSKYISDWLENYSRKISINYIGHMASVGNDFQNQRMIFIDNKEKGNWKKGGRHTRITAENLMYVSIYFSIRKVVEATWLNDRDQFLFPNNKWETDKEFQNDCLTFTIFSNNIQSKYGVNHWIPFAEQEINAREKFDSNFMSNFIGGKLKSAGNCDLFDNQTRRTAPLVFSPEATAVFDAGREFWKYYHKQPNCNVNASLYDIREHFQGRNEAGKMNNKSLDEAYTDLIGNLREKLRQLAEKIEPKVYEYEFLRQ